MPKRVVRPPFCKPHCTRPEECSICQSKHVDGETQ
jgi:hypothetical protein